MTKASAGMEENGRWSHSGSVTKIDINIDGLHREFPETREAIFLGDKTPRRLKTEPILL